MRSLCSQPTSSSGGRRPAHSVDSSRGNCHWQAATRCGSARGCRVGPTTMGRMKGSNTAAIAWARLALSSKGKSPNTSSPRGIEPFLCRRGWGPREPEEVQAVEPRHTSRWRRHSPDRGPGCGQVQTQVPNAYRPDWEAADEVLPPCPSRCAMAALARASCHCHRTTPTR